MENQFLLNAGIPAPAPSLTMPAWQSLSSAMEIQATGMNRSPEHSQDCFFNPNSSTDYGMQFESALSSMVSSPAASNSNISNESLIIRELIGKLGSIGNCGEISPHSQPLLASYINGNNSANTSCYSTPLNSPPKLNLPLMDGLVKEKLPSLGKSLRLNSSVAEFSADPGFAERAAKFSCFGSRSFNGRTTHLGLNNNAEIAGYRSNSLTANVKLSRISSSPSLKAMGSQVTNNSNSPLQNRSEVANSQEESTISEQNPNVDPAMKPYPRKRKAVSKAKSKETSSAKVSEPNEKRCKSTESNENENGSVKAEEDANAGDDKQKKTDNNNDTKPPEPPKDYIHVRARRGQATDSHSLAERVRREKISERMKFLQNLVPGCNKVTGKALMLDEIINYVQSLQRQVEFLSMKLASVNTRLDFNADSLMSKDIFQSNNTLPHAIFPTDSSASALYGQQNPALHCNISNGTMTQCPVDPLVTVNTHLPFTINHFTQTAPQPQPQNPTVCEGDLQSIVGMEFGQISNEDMALGSQNFHQGQIKYPTLT